MYKKFILAKKLDSVTQFCCKYTMQQEGDLRDRMLGFGKGALCGGLTLIAVKTGLGV